MIDVALRPRTFVSLCTGYGGLDRAIVRACPGIRAVAAIERQAYPAAVLASRMGEGALDPCPIWDDLESFDCEPYRGRVDLVVAGFPCQGASVAGKRQGIDDERWLWPLVFRIFRQLDATWLFIENVPGLLSVNGGGAFEEILRDLASCGLAAEWDCVSAASVGAPHLRDRLFLLAADPDRIAVRIVSERDQWSGRRARAPKRRKTVADGGSSARSVADTDGERCGSRIDDVRTRQPDVARGASSDSSSEGPQGTGAGRTASDGASTDADGHGDEAPDDGCEATGDEGRASTGGGGGGLAADPGSDGSSLGPERARRRSRGRNEVDEARLRRGEAPEPDDPPEQSSERARRARGELARDHVGGSGGDQAADSDNEPTGTEQGIEPDERTDLASRGGASVADTARERRDEGDVRRSRASGRRGSDVAGSDHEARGTGAATDADEHGLQGERDGGQLDTGERPERGGDVDGRSRPWSRHAVDLVGAIVDDGREHWSWSRAPEPTIRGVDDGPAFGVVDGAYADELHLLGNGVVEHAAAVGFALAWDRLHGTSLVEFRNADEGE